MQNIKNIIFDLGGIFIEIDYNSTDQAFKNLGVTNFAELYTQHHANPLFEQLETGQLSPAEFYDAFRTATGLQLSNSEIEGAWNAMLGTFAKDKLDWLKNIRTKYNIYLYSNTNLIHYDRFQEIFRSSSGEGSFDDYFIKAYYSHDLGLRKPYPDSYIAILEREKLEAAETLFIDDTPKNIEGAKAAGLQTILLQHPKTVLDLDL